MKPLPSWEKELLWILTETPAGIAFLLSYPAQVSVNPSWFNHCTIDRFKNEGSLCEFLVLETGFHLDIAIGAFSVWRRSESMRQIPIPLPTVAGI